MTNKFLDKIMSLAESDDETMLLLKQVVTPVNGEIEYYSDGTPRSVYPAYLPRLFISFKIGRTYFLLQRL